MPQGGVTGAEAEGNVFVYATWGVTGAEAGTESKSFICEYKRVR